MKAIKRNGSNIGLVNFQASTYSLLNVHLSAATITSITNPSNRGKHNIPIEWEASVKRGLLYKFMQFFSVAIACVSYKVCDSVSPLCFPPLWSLSSRFPRFTPTIAFHSSSRLLLFLLAFSFLLHFLVFLLFHSDSLLLIFLVFFLKLKHK